MLIFRSFNRFILISLALLGLSVFNLAQSALVESDFLAVGDGLLFVDTATNREWVDVTKTTNMSVNEFFNTSIYSGVGFQLADQTSLLGLYTNAGATSVALNNTQTYLAGNVAAAQQLNALMEHISPFSQTAGNPWVHGMMDFGSVTNVTLSRFRDAGNGTASFGINTNGTSRTLDSRQGDVGVWAYRNATPSAVPVPAAVWLFGTALMGFVGMSRRRKVA